MFIWSSSQIEVSKPSQDHSENQTPVSQTPHNHNPNQTQYLQNILLGYNPTQQQPASHFSMGQVGATSLLSTGSTSIPCSPHTHLIPPPWRGPPSLPQRRQPVRRHLHLVRPASPQAAPEPSLQHQDLTGRGPLGHHREVFSPGFQTVRLHQD